MWRKECIPDSSFLFVRVGKDFISSQDGLPKKTSFKNTPSTGPDLSSDWDKYSTAESSRELIGKQINPRNGEFKNPLNFYIWKFGVEKLRHTIEPKQEVKHCPIYNKPEIIGVPNNRAHSSIIGEKPVDNDAKFRTKMLRAGQWAISPQNNI